MKCGNSNEVIHKDVVIIGNGPSGITLSYMLSGNIPFVTSYAHPDEFLSARLATVLNKSLIHEDLDYLSGGLEGRTTNPVSLLIDNLMHPCADIGLELEPLVEWRSDGYEVHGSSYLVYRIFIVTLCFITYIHILSCVSMAWIGYENPWSEDVADSMMILKNYGPSVDNFTIMYVLFFYSTCLMVMNAGYRLVSFSNASLLFTVNVWVVSRIIFILTLSYFMELYAVTHSSRQKYIDIVNEVKDCMRHKHIPEFLRKRILAYYDVKYQNYYFQETEILNTVSGQLRQISHVVLGKGPPGGSWNSMDPQILTLSLGSWMGLPGLPYKSRHGSETRASAKNVADYYKHYVEQMDLTKNFKNHTLVTSIKPYNYRDLKSKWVEKVDSDITKKAKLCSRLEAKETSRSCTFSKLCSRLESSRSSTKASKLESKSCTFSNAINYLLSRSQKKAREEDFLSILGSDYKCDSCSKEQRKSNKLKPRVPNSSKHCDSYRWLVEAVDLRTKECFTYTCNYLVVANGSSDLPNRLSISDYKTDPCWLLYDLRSLEIELDLMIQSGGGIVDPVLVIGAGLSAADAIIATRGRNVDVLHLFRNKSSTLGKQLPENMYPEYHKVHQMMKNESKYPYYTPLPETTLTTLDQEHRTVTLKYSEGIEETLKISFVVVLIGSKPDMSFLPTHYNIAVKKNQPLDCKTNTVSINKMTHSVNGCEGLYALGPLAGDNFVRFLPGGALAVLSDLYKKMEL